MSLESSRISIVSSVKANPRQLGSVGDTAAILPGAQLVKQEAERRCNLCCMSYGCFISSIMTLCITGAGTAVSILAEKRVQYSLNGAMRQVAWLAIPGTIVGMTLHFFLSEAMWSSKKNSWGQAWMKAMAFNTALWGVGIGAGTLVWRQCLPRFAAGRRIYHRIPIPAEPLEARLLRSGDEFFSGMGWSYWLSGVVSGQLGYMTCVNFCVWNDRPYYMMSPQGGYARSCMPSWRREQFQQIASRELK